MRIRSFIVAVAAVATLAACSSSKSSNTLPGTGGQSSVTSSSATSSSAGGGGGANAAVCARFNSATKQVSSGMSAISSPATAKDAINRAITLLKAVGSGAPGNVKAAVDDLVSAFRTAESALSGSTPDYAKLQGLQTRVPADLQVLETYIAQNCAGLHS
jgi:hypothetical protein